MPRPRAQFPAYCLHKASGQAVVYIDRKPNYLGRFDSAESRAAYAKLIERLATGRAVQPAPSSAPPVERLTVNELIVAFVTREMPRFSSSEQYCFRAAIKVLRPLFGETPAVEFGPLRFRIMREAMVAGEKAVNMPPRADGKPQKDRKPWCRKTVNDQAKRVRAMFRWAASWEMIPAQILTNLETVKSLAIGESPAVDYAPRESVPQEHIDAARKELRSYFRDLLDLMLLTGARSGEILSLTGTMIERRDAVWLAELHRHKTARKGKRRFLVFNFAAQAILLRYFKPDPNAKLFPHRRDNFTVAVRRACERAGVPVFVPHQLRHTTAAKLVDDVGLEAAQAVLGHSEAAMTLHYSRSAEKQATAAVQKLG